jgi:hypothetical protein
MVHGDLCGPITLSTPSGKKMFLLLVYDYNRFMWIKLLSSKDGAQAAIKHISRMSRACPGRR